MTDFTPGPWSIHAMGNDGQPRFVTSGEWEFNDRTIGAGETIIASASWNNASNGGYPSVATNDHMIANANLIAAAPEIFDALRDLSEVFALDDEGSLDRFERLAAMFREDTGYLAPGKDQPMCGPDQPDGDELRAIYDGWYAAKVTRARAALAKALGK